MIVSELHFSGTYQHETSSLDHAIYHLATHTRSETVCIAEFLYKETSSLETTSYRFLIICSLLPRRLLGPPGNLYCSY